MNSNNKQKQRGQDKEKEPLGTTPESYLRELGKEHEIPQEVRKIGVVQRQETVEVPEDIQQMGVHLTGISTPIPFQPTLKLPITDEEIEKGLQASIFSSLRWLAEWCIYILKRFHLTLKTIHGRVRRVRYKI